METKIRNIEEIGRRDDKSKQYSISKRTKGMQKRGYN